MEYARFSPGTITEATASEQDRLVTADISDENVALDYHRVFTSGIDTSDFERNGGPVLFAHQQDNPPVALTTRIWKAGPILRATMKFAPAEVYPFADTVYKLIRFGALNATSISWFPTEYKPARDRSRPDGLDFISCKLIEYSIVPCPANPNALITARDAGIDVRPIREWAARVLDGVTMSEIRSLALSAHRQLAPTIHQGASMPQPTRAEGGANWKCGASRNLPLSEEGAWDGPAAEKSVFEACGFDGDKPDLGKARKAFLAYDAANPKERGSYKLPFAKVVEGRLVAMASGIRAAASRLPQTDIPDNVKDSARAVIDHYEGQMSSSNGGRAAIKFSKRDMQKIAELAWHLHGLNDLTHRVEGEEEGEGDTDSKNPEFMHKVLQAAAEALKNMHEEETQEMLDEHAKGQRGEATGSPRALHGSFFRAKLSKDDKDKAEAIYAHCARSHRLLRSHIDHFKDEDLGDEDNRALMMDSAEGVHDHCVASARCVREFIDGQAPPTADNLEPIAGRAAPKPAQTPAPKPAEKTADDRKREAATLRAKSLIHDV
jgi:hypothetical protein